ncbi:MAG: hypothetical protein JSV24_00525 [Bacteroidales bacterium]|nr:MAG: hypothetical protein JSV24_00525 [Bacteroidales bacterium]
MKVQRFQYSYAVHSYELDAGLRVPLTVVGNYIQDIAGKHAKAMNLGYEDMLAWDQFWVLSRLRISMKKYPGWNDTLNLETWPSGIGKLFAIREFRILDEKKEVIGDAASAWLIVDRSSRRPRSPEILKDRIPVIPVSTTEVKLEKLPGVGCGTEHKPFVVKYSDLDQNNHANNVKYLQWILDSYPGNYCIDHLVKVFEINFLSETSLDDEIVIRTESVNGPGALFRHSLFRVSDEKEICRAQLEWQ